MLRFLRPLTRFRRFFAMDVEENSDVLYDSQEKLYELIEAKKDKNTAVLDYLKNVKYPPVADFKDGLEWFNVSEPISFSKHLKGKVVVLDFFCYCCINCMHILPDLKEIEKEFTIENGLVVVGVHSAKFENEKISQNILAAVQRYNISHPVVNDYNSEMWKNCDVHCWPTLLVLGPNFNPLIMFTGEGHKEDLKLVIRNALEYYQKQKLISDHKLPLKSAYHLLPDIKGPFLFPGKITNFVSSKNEEILAISDTGNNRVIIINTDGTLLYQIGGKGMGFADGNLENAEFNNPQGLAFLNEDTLIVADTENHALRKVDLKEGSVKTIAGTGVQGHDTTGGKLWSQQAISSPWDVCIYKTNDQKNVVIIAMAGSHQIWALFLDDTVWWKNKKYAAGTCVCIAGSGREENRNNAYPNSAAFAQPSGLAISKENNEIYIADSESSSIRRLSLVDGKVSSVVGGDRNPNNLFAFGDKDGKSYDAKLQHSLGVATSKDGKKLYVADTYNHKIKKVDIAENSISTLKNGLFKEPGGLCVSIKDDKKLFVADTNSHGIKTLTLNDGDIAAIETIELKLQIEEMDCSKLKSKVFDTNASQISSNGAKLILSVDITYQNGLKLTEGAPQKWVAILPDATWSCVPKNGDDLKKVEVIVSVPPQKDAKETFVDVFFDIVTCTEETCHPKTFAIRFPIVYESNAATNIKSDVKVILDPENIEIS